MQKFTKTTRTLAALLVSGTALTGVASAADISANFGVTSDYIWRGMTQNGGNTSASGGFDADFGNGVYAGTWVGDVAFAGADGSNTNATQETDFYVGYAGESGSISYDVGYIMYTYDADDINFDEVYVTVGTGGVSLSYYTLVGDDGDADAGDATYISVDYETEIGELGLALHYGAYDAEDWGLQDSTDMSITLSKGDFSLAYVTTDDLTGDDDENRMVVSWGASF